MKRKLKLRKEIKLIIIFILMVVSFVLITCDCESLITFLFTKLIAIFNLLIINYIIKKDKALKKALCEPNM